MTIQQATPVWAPERQWAKDVVRAIPLPEPPHLPGLVQAVAHYTGQRLAIAEVEATVINGALERRGGVTTIRVPAHSTGRHRRFPICRGLARVLYRAPGARDGQLDLSQPPGREVEFAALALAHRLYRTRHPKPRPAT